MAQGVRLFFGFLGLLASGAACAHTGIHAVGGYLTGISHPGIAHPHIGMDHLLAVVAVSILSVRFGERRRLSVPAAFITIGLLGGWLLLSA